MFEEAEALTRENTGLKLVIAFNYGSRQEITRAVRVIARKVAEGKIDPEDITPAVIGNHLDTGGLPEPDLLIRTGGEQRLSNYLLWQCAYTEFVFIPEYWPEFDAEHLQPRHRHVPHARPALRRHQGPDGLMRRRNLRRQGANGAISACAPSPPRCSSPPFWRMSGRAASGFISSWR